jgi:acyl carrier protein
MEQFLAKLAEILETGELKEDSRLESFPAWDSLGVLSAIAMIESLYRVNLTSPDLAGIETVDELWKLVQAKRID